MEGASDNRNLLIKLINKMDNLDMQQILAYAAGYEAGKTSHVSLDSIDSLRNPPKQTA
ncbi:MAG: hypothetical protein HFG68_04645 [Hungatella sp.]|nr:hypothetical protein [Hungatella sp.]